MKIYLSALAALIILFFAHWAGNAYLLYVRFPGYDIPMHVLGGLGLGLSAIAFLTSCKFELKGRFWIIPVLIFIAGFIWELFEAYYGIAGAPVGTKAYYIDTVKDLFDDVLGSVIAVLAVRRFG